jgi:peptide/nickel transport system substrate-binding protein
VTRLRITMIGAATAVGLAAFGLTAGAETIQPDRTITIALSARSPLTTDPIRSTIGPDAWVIENMYEQLVRPPDGQFGLRPEDFRPILAESWEASEDSRTWTFELRRGVQFHKGYGEVTSDDVKFSLDRARSGGTNVELYANVTSVETDGPYRVIIGLDDPDPLFLSSTIYHQNSNIVSRKAVEEKGEGFGPDGIGTGPYELAGFDTEDGVRLVAYQDYWGDKAKVGNLHVQYVADGTARTLALLGGEVDMIEGVRTLGWADSVLAQRPDIALDMTVPGSFNHLSINLTHPPFDDLRVRQALMWALDLDEITESFTPMGGPMVGMNPPTFPPFLTWDEVPEDLRYGYDPDKAKALLAEAGYPDGFTFTSSVSQRADYQSLMLVVQDMLREVGMNLDLRVIDHATFHTVNNAGENTLSPFSSSYPPVPYQTFVRHLHSDSVVNPEGTGGRNFAYYGVAMPGVDDLLAQMRDEPDYDKHMSLAREVELRVLRDLPVIGLTTLSYVIARNPRVDIGYEVQSGFARWRLDSATFVD